MSTETDPPTAANPRLPRPTSEGEGAALMECVKPDAEPKRCGAKLRNKNAVCRQWGIQPSGRCRLHGGVTPRGPDAGAFKHGLYSKALPKNLKKSFESLTNDPNLLEGRAEVALMQLRLTQLSGRVQCNESGRAWAQLKALFTRFKAANDEENQAGMLAALNEMSVLVDGEVNDEAAWAELTEYVDKATRVAEREWKRVIANRQVVTVEQVHAIAAALIAAVNANVKDTQTRLAIAEHFKRLNVVAVQPLLSTGSGTDVAEPVG